MAEAVTESVKTASKTFFTETSARLGSLSKYVDSLSASLQDAIPRTAVMWAVLLVALIIIVLLSRMMSLQKSIHELQARPMVDEFLVRQVVRAQLEDTLRAMEQHHKAQMALRAEAARQAAHEAASQAPPPATAPVIESSAPIESKPAVESTALVESAPAVESAPTAPAVESAPTAPAVESAPTAPAVESVPTAPAVESVPTAPAAELEPPIASSAAPDVITIDPNTVSTDTRRKSRKRRSAEPEILS